MTIFISSDDVEKILALGRKRSSIKTYDYQMKRIYAMCFKTTQFDRDLLVSKYDDLKKYISDIKKPAEQARVLNVIKYFMNKDDYDRLYHQMYKKYTELYRLNMYYSGTLKPFVSLEKLSVVPCKTSIKNIVKNLYTLHIPLRGQEYYDTIVSSDTNNNCNCYNQDTGIMTLHRYKTSSKYGPRIVKFPKVLKDKINEWILQNNITEGKHLLVNRNGDKYTQSAFSRLLNSIFGKGISTDFLRHIYISEFIHHIFTDTETIDDILELRKSLAKVMGHSLPSQELVYNNYSMVRGNIEWSSKSYMNDVINRFTETL